MKPILAFLLITLVFSAQLIGGESKVKKKIMLSKATVTSDAWMNANRMNGIYRNNGIWLYDVVAGDWGLEWPKGSGLSPIYAGGQWIGALVDGETRVAGIQHSATEFQPGEITAPYTATNPRDAQYRWYEIRSDGSGDWNDWPVDQGAPVDENGDPLLIGDQTIFSIWNDMAEHAWVGTNKLSVEVRQTVWAFNRADALGDMQFVKWQMVNKSGVDWDSTYFSIWLDPDLGEAGDDLVGCDTTLGLGYCYNAANNDQNYGSAPPATGIDFFQGPLIDQPGSTVQLPDGTVLQDKEMLKMTSFVFYNNDDSPQGNPQTGGDVWNYMRGFWRDNSRITEGARGTDPNNPPTRYMFSGDPETNAGWLDSEEADRRFLMTTGPFVMKAWEDVNGNGMPDFGEPGVQEIVAGVIVTRGENNLNSVTSLKTVDELAQLAYDLNFELTKAPVPPAVGVTEMPNEVILSWDNACEWNDLLIPYYSVDPIVQEAMGSTVIIDNTIKEVDDADYNFYGYTVYQYSDASGRDPVVVQHWDMGQMKEATPYTGPRLIRILENQNPMVGNTGDRLINGKEYYFGVAAEAYLEFGAPPIFSSPPTIVTVVPQYEPGVRAQTVYNDSLSDIEYILIDPQAGYADANVVVRVIDPSAVTGHDYEIFFDHQHYYRDLDGKWKFTNYPDSVGKYIAGPTDVSGSTLIPTAVFNYDHLGTVDINLELDLVSSTGAWIDGVQITFPAEVTINYAEDGHPTGGPSDPTPAIDGQTIIWGNQDRSEWGGYTGHEIFTVNVDNFTPPITVDYIIYDDGYESGGNPIDAPGSAVIDKVTYAFRTERHMNVKDLTTDEIVLEDHTEVFPPGASTVSAPVVDGIQIIVNGSFDAPETYGTILVNGADQGAGWDISDYTDFGLSPLSREKNGYGSASVTDLQQDYEFRFTGELDSVTVNGQKIYITKEGTGSIATFYGARLYEWELHPLNPTGTKERFTVRIPFEVWNVDLGIQVNYQIYDRHQTDPAADGFYTWNPNGRMYCEVLNSPYSEEVISEAMIDPESPDYIGDSFTWNHVWHESHWTTGDVVTIQYANPLKLGLDKFTFSTTGLDQRITANAQRDDLEKINVAPNPYYGFHSGELDPFDRWVQFTFLPEECTIRIFDLAGNLVRRLEKTDPGSSLLQWDLKNETGLPVASSIYIYIVEVPGVGEKVGKMAIFTPNERVDVY